MLGVLGYTLHTVTLLLLHVDSHSKCLALWTLANSNGVTEVALSCPTLYNPVDCSLPGSSFHGIFQARILQWVAISFSMGSSWPKDWTHISCVSCIAGRFFHRWAIWEVNILTLITLAISLLPFMQCNMIIAVTSCHIYRGKGSCMGKRHWGSFWNSVCGYIRWALLLILGLEWE